MKRTFPFDSNCPIRAGPPFVFFVCIVILDFFGLQFILIRAKRNKSKS